MWFQIYVLLIYYAPLPTSRSIDYLDLQMDPLPEVAVSWCLPIGRPCLHSRRIKVYLSLDVLAKTVGDGRKKMNLK